MLTQGRKLPAVFGTGEPKENAADLRTTGYEISLSWRDEFKAGRHPFHYGLSFILADATSKITKFDNPAGLLSSHRVGEEIGELWGYVYDGFFQTDEEAAEYTSRVKYGNVAQFGNAGGYKAGDIRIRDVDGNGYINEGANTVSNPGDKVKLGNSTPRYSYGITLTASWNGIDLYMLFQGIGSKLVSARGDDALLGSLLAPLRFIHPAGLHGQSLVSGEPRRLFPPSDRLPAWAGSGPHQLNVPSRYRLLQTA